MSRIITPFIDGIVVRETKDRLAEHARHMQYGIEAAEALAWFKEYGEGKRASSVFETNARVIASLTPGAGHANGFLKLASDFYSDLIFAKAVELAAGQMRDAEEKRNPPRTRR